MGGLLPARPAPDCVAHSDLRCSVGAYIWERWLGPQTELQGLRERQVSASFASLKIKRKKDNNKGTLLTSKGKKTGNRQEVPPFKIAQLQMMTEMNLSCES